LSRKIWIEEESARRDRRLKLEQEELAEKQEWSEEELIEHFQRWARNPKVREQVCDKCLSSEEKERRIRAIFGLESKEDNGDAAEVLAQGSGEGKIEDDVEIVPTGNENQIKVNQTSLCGPKEI
jgi:hypothetical protein